VLILLKKKKWFIPKSVGRVINIYYAKTKVYIPRHLDSIKNRRFWYELVDRIFICRKQFNENYSIWDRV